MGARERIEEISAQDARRVVLRAQMVGARLAGGGARPQVEGRVRGGARPQVEGRASGGARPAGGGARLREGSRAVTRAQVLKLVGRIAPLQIDSVNVLARTQYLPIFSRLGAYDRAFLDQLAYGKRALVEAWAHEASFVPVEMWPWLAWRRRAHHHRWVAWARSHRRLLDAVMAEIRARGPLAASDLKEGGRSTGPWWGWSQGKSAMEFLFADGQLAVTSRRNFERVYDLTERVLPAEILGARAPTEHEARKLAIMHAVRACGIGTAKDLFDYFRLQQTKSMPALRELVEEGMLIPVRVAGWADLAYVGFGPVRAPVCDAATLLSPFDPVVWYRDRTHRLFGFHYRIEIYVPPPKRVHGYYVLPFLMDEDLVARIDLKADRSGRALLVQGAHAEPGRDRRRIAARLAPQLHEMARWLGLDEVIVKRNGDLARALSVEVRAR